jgi:hypothetical protein
VNREAGPDEAVPSVGVAYRRSRLEPSGSTRSTRSLRRGAVIVAALVGLALVKPWGVAEEPAGLPVPPRTVAVASAEPTRPHDPIEDICHASPSWRVTSVGLFVGSKLRESGFVTPVAAAGPGDPSIPFVLFGFSRVSALGYCAPVRTSSTGDLEVRVFRMGVDGAGTLLKVMREEATPVTSLAGLFSVIAASGGAASGTAGPTASWPPGRYVFALRGEDYGDVWFGADLRPTLDEPEGTAR